MATRRHRIWGILCRKISTISQRRLKSDTAGVEALTFCAEGYVVASDNVDGGGEDVYKKNEIISVVTTKTEDVIFVPKIEVFAHRLAALGQARGRSARRRLPGTKGRHLCAPNAFHALRLRSKFS